jgi:hypothetical protein
MRCSVAAFLAFLITRTWADPDLWGHIRFGGDIGTRTHVIRPQIFSLLLFAVLLWLIVQAERGKPRYLMAVPAVFVAWANLHGGWIVGLGVLLFWSISRLLLKAPAGIGLRRPRLLQRSVAGIASTFSKTWNGGRGISRIPYVFSAADLLLHLATGEGFPVTVQEAMASGPATNRNLVDKQWART